MTTFGTLFSGGELAGIGMQAAGLTHKWGIEIRDDIAQIARNNGFNVITADVLQVDPATMEPVDCLHASPVCTRASNANHSAELNDDGTKEAPLDITMGEKVAQFIDVLAPRVVTVENVYAYRNFKAFKIILAALNRGEYMWDFDNLNSADFGGWELCPIHDLRCTQECVPSAGQSFYQDLPIIAPDIVAILAMMSPEGEAMHLAKDAVAHLARVIKRDIVVNAQWQSMRSRAFVGEKKITLGRVVELLMSVGISKLELMESIDANIESLLNTCLDAPLLRARLSITRTETLKITLLKILSCLKTTVYTPNFITKNAQNQMDGDRERSGNCPLCRHVAVPQTRRRLVLRAVRGALLPNLPQPERWVGWYEAIFDIIHTLPKSQFAKWQIPRLPKEIVDSLILDCQNAGDPDENGNRSVTIRSGKEPMFTVSSSMSKRPARAFLIDGDGNRSRTPTILADNDPSFTIQAWHGRRPANNPRAWLETGRVVSMTPRALARFQSAPDNYMLPPNNKLACTIIGNGVPSLLMQKIYQGLVGV